MFLIMHARSHNAQTNILALNVRALAVFCCADFMGYGSLVTFCCLYLHMLLDWWDYLADEPLHIVAHTIFG